MSLIFYISNYLRYFIKVHRLCIVFFFPKKGNRPLDRLKVIPLSHLIILLPRFFVASISSSVKYYEKFESSSSKSKIKPSTVLKICLKRDKRNFVVTFSQVSIQSRCKAVRIEDGHQRNSKLWRVTTWEIHSG